MLPAKITSFVSGFYKTPSPTPAPNAGNVTFVKSVTSVRNTTVYRADTRSPETIRKFGFSGTNSNEPGEVRVFGKNTVFASTSKEKVKDFIHMIEHQGQSKKYHLYQIQTKKQEVFSFRENMDKNPTSLINGIADLAVQELGIPQDEAVELAKSAIQSDYLAVDEVQVEGPISPANIKHIDTISIDE